MASKPNKIEIPATPRKPPQLPQRPSYERVLENIEQWVNSNGLRKPT